MSWVDMIIFNLHASMSTSIRFTANLLRLFIREKEYILNLATELKHVFILSFAMKVSE